MSYERQTREAYRNIERAGAYKQRQTSQWSWMRFSTRREQSVLVRLAMGLRLGADAVVLDAPCGTGVLGALLRRLGCQVVAADISREMMALAGAEYDPKTFRGFLQGDLLQLPLASDSVHAAFILGFLHRVPAPIRRGALAELARVTRGPIVATCSLDGVVQRVKARVLGLLSPGYLPAPNRALLVEIEADCRAAGLRIARLHRPMPLLSANAVLVLEHQRETED